jgi:hypothetical protein
MSHLIRQRAAIILFVLLCGAGAMSSTWRVQSWGNDLSLVDQYSEANVLREVRNFLQEGLFRYYGLGNVYYTGMYPADGFAGDPEVAKTSVSPEGVYTHYPPGPEYLAYAAAKLMGPEPVSRLRLLPIAAGWAAMIFLGLAVRRRFGGAVAWLVMGACALSPTVADGFVGLHSQGYACALLMVEIGLAIGTGTAFLPFALLGFLQGWLSFDYVFLVTFAPLAIELAMPRIDLAYRGRWKLAMTRVALAGGGFAAAHGLHFLQIWAYLGSFDAALRDLAGAAAHRAGAGMIEGPIGYLFLMLGNLKYYFYGVHPFHLGWLPADPDSPDLPIFRFLGLSLGPWWLLISVALIIWDELTSRRHAGSLRMGWHVVCLSGMLTSSLWLMVMVNHGVVHRHFLYRHMFILFFVMVLFGAVRASRLWAQSTAPGRLLHGRLLLRRATVPASRL